MNTKVMVIADSREPKSVLKALDEQVELEIRTLEVGDYVISSRVAIERKTVQDFFNTLFQRRELFSQLKDLASAYERPVLIVEGGDLFSSGRQVHPNAIRGMIAHITVDLQMPILYTYSPEDTASLIAALATREQIAKRKGISVHGKRSTMTLQEQQEYIISAIPNVGIETARALLKHFGSVEKVLTAPVEELIKVKGVGKKTASAIRRVATGDKYI